MARYKVVFSRMIQQTISIEVDVDVEDDVVAEFAAREELARREHNEYVEWETPQQEMKYERESADMIGLPEGWLDARNDPRMQTLGEMEAEDPMVFKAANLHEPIVEGAKTDDLPPPTINENPSDIDIAADSLRLLSNGELAECLRRAGRMLADVGIAQQFPLTSDVAVELTRAAAKIEELIRFEEQQ